MKFLVCALLVSVIAVGSCVPVEEAKAVVVGAAEVDENAPKCQPDVDSFLADPSDCGSFYQCANGVAYHFTCPDDLLFDITTLSCNFADNVKCGGFECPKPGHYYPTYHPDPEDCHSYYSCRRGEAKHHKCPGHLHYNALMHSCVMGRSRHCKRSLF